MTSGVERRLPPVLRVADVRALEARHAGEPLMERAGVAAAAVARAMAGDRGRPVVVLAGPGNNGGDGFALARCLKEAYYDVAVVFRDDATVLPADAAAAHARYVDAGGSTAASPPDGAPALVIDALFGIGMTRPLARQHAELVEWANRQNVPRLALDVPTGLDADRGIARAPSFKATATATFIALKPGLLTADGPAACGEVSVHDLGLDAREVAGAGRMLDWATLRASLPEPLRRKMRNAHKGTFGTLGIIGGAEGLVGAALIAARAAARAGAGKVRVGVLASGRPAVDFVMPESMLTSVDSVLDQSADALVVGCGLGSGRDAVNAVTQALAKPVPIVLDADALNMLGASATLRAAVRRRDAYTIATPHPAEAARLLDTTVAVVQQDRLAAAWSIARELRAHVVLKGGGSVLAHPDGTWDINASGNPALGVAGSGDALAGIVGAFLAQGIDAKEALRYGVCLHGAAADALVARGIGPVGVSTGEIIDAARDLVNAANRAD